MKLFQSWTNKAYRTFGLGLSVVLLSAGGLSADCCKESSSSSSSSCSSSSSSFSCSESSEECTTCTDSDTSPEAISLGTRLTECFWATVQAQSGPCLSKKLKDKISGAFLGINPDFTGLPGSKPYLERCGFLEYLRVHKITSFEILQNNGSSLFARLTRDRKFLTVFYVLHTVGFVVGTSPLQTFDQTTRNLDVWKKGKDCKWRLISHVEQQLLL